MLPGVAQITGVWRGKSVSRSKDETEWTETVITAKVDESSVFDSLVVEGHGTSVWKRKVIPFVIKGTYDPSTKLLQFRKRHYGAFTNEILYKGILLPSAIHKSARFEGVYEQGTIELTKTSQIALGIPPLLTGRYSATCSFDGITQEWDNLDVTIASRTEGASPADREVHVLPRLFQLSGTGTAYDTTISDGSNKPVRNEMTASEINLVGTVDLVTQRVSIETYSRRTQERLAFECLVNPSTMEIATLNDQEQQPVQSLRMVQENRDLLLEAVPHLWRNAIVSYQLQFSTSESNSTVGSEGRGMRQYMARKEDIRALCGYLQGTWTGISTDVHGKVTHVKPLRLTADHENDNLHIKLEGSGESVWNDMTVQYSLRGALDTMSLQFEMEERFHGVVRNPVRYVGALCLTSTAPAAENANTSTDRYMAPTDVKQIVDNVASGTSALCLRGDFDRGKILLWQTRDSQRHESTAVPEQPATSVRESQPSSTHRNPSNEARVVEYRLMLSRMLLSKNRISDRDRKALRVFKDASNITDEEHREVLHDLGWTTDMLDLSPETTVLGGDGDESKEARDDLCTLCYDGVIDSVFTPCGHFVVCRKCSRKVKECPVCRRAIASVQVVYR